MSVNETAADVVQRLKEFLEHSPKSPGTLAPTLHGWLTHPDQLFVCAVCAGRIMARGCQLPRGSEPVWTDQNVKGKCCCCDSEVAWNDPQGRLQAGDTGFDPNKPDTFAKSYVTWRDKLVSDSARATEAFTEDELENFAGGQ